MMEVQRKKFNDEEKETEQIFGLGNSGSLSDQINDTG
jgi:hypothetical protein